MILFVAILGMGTMTACGPDPDAPKGESKEKLDYVCVDPECKKTQQVSVNDPKPK